MRGIHDRFDSRIHAARFLEKAKGKFRAQAERVLPVNAAPRKRQLDVLPHGLPVRNMGKIDRVVQNRRRGIRRAHFFAFGLRTSLTSETENDGIICFVL